MDFFERTGKMAIGSRLRRLTERLTSDAERIYDLFGVAIRPKWFPVFFVLAHDGPRSVTDIARHIGHTHPSISNIVKEMKAAGLIEEKKDDRDARRHVVTLTAEGVQTARRLEEQCADVETAIEQLAEHSAADLWGAIAEWEALLAERSLFERVKACKRARENREIRIVPYEPRFLPAFRKLNEAWITEHWQLEEADLATLGHPRETILDHGGHIFVALDREQPVGVCALCRMDHPDYDYELAKLAVDPLARGKGIGRRLCETAIDHARSEGCKRLFLESNTRLEPAIRLYRDLGFREIRDARPAYARGDIQMQLTIK